GTDDTENPGGIAALGDIVVTPPIRHARDAGLLTPSPMFCRFTPTGVQWSTGDQVALDAVIWCTGFRPDLGHLQGLNLRSEEHTSELQSRFDLVCRLLLEKKKQNKHISTRWK